MKARMSLFLPGALVVPVVFAAPQPAAGAGFAIHEQGAAATGRGCAVTAVADTPSALYYNPAGLTMQGSFGVELGDTLIMPLATHVDPATRLETDAEDNVFYPPTVYAAMRFGAGIVVGLGVFSPYGLGMEWPAGWAGDDEIRSIDLQTFDVDLAIAWRPLEWLAIAAGLDTVITTVELQKKLDFVEQRRTLHAAATTFGVGGNAGLLVRILEDRLSFGVSYRSAVGLSFVGDADFTVPTPFADRMQDQPLESSITLPHRIALGIAWLPIDLLTLSLDVDITTWSSFDRFGFTFPEDADRPEDERLTQFEPRNWSDTFAIRFGVQVRPPDRDFALRLGLVYDRSPSPTNTMSPSLPDADRVDVAVGAGYEFGGGFRFDVAYMYVHMFERSTTGDAFPGTYRSSAHLVGFSLGYSYGE